MPCGTVVLVHVVLWVDVVVLRVVVVVLDVVLVLDCKLVESEEICLQARLPADTEGSLACLVHIRALEAHGRNITARKYERSFDKYFVLVLQGFTQ